MIFESTCFPSEGLGDLKLEALRPRNSPRWPKFAELHAQPRGPELIHWRDGKKVICRDWIQDLLSDLSPIAEKFNMKYLLKPIYKVLEEGNQSMKWIKLFEKGLSIEQIMKIASEDMIKGEEKNI